MAWVKFFTGIHNERVAMLKQGLLIVVILSGFIFICPASMAQNIPYTKIISLDQRVYTLENRIDRLDSKFRNDSTGLVLLLFGAFCALWAQNTGRNAWLWFFLGLFFNIITVLVLLAKNSGNRRRIVAEKPQ
jgi:hypothetical protein